MDLTPYVDGLRADLTTAAAVGDEQSRRLANALASALEPAARLAIMHALADLAAEVTANLDDRVVDLRLDGRDVRVTVTPEAGSGGYVRSPDAARLGETSGDISRITLRLLEQLKSQAERSAATQGISLNAWISQAVQGALRHDVRGDDWAGGPGVADSAGGAGREHGRGQRRVQGWVQG